MAYLQGTLAERGTAADTVVQAPSSLNDELNDLPELVAVYSRNENVMSRGDQLPATVWTISGAHPFQLMQVGRRPRAADEAAVRGQVRQALDLSVGDRLAIGAGGSAKTVTVVGFALNLANAKDASILLLDIKDARSHATYWIASPAALASMRGDSTIGPALKSGILSLTSNQALLSESANNLPEQVSLLHAARVVFAGASILLILLVLLSAGGVARRDAASLQAAGVAERRSWLLICGVAMAAATSGAVTGSLMAVGAVRSTRHIIEVWFSGSWLGTDPDWPTVALVAVGALSVVPASVLQSQRLTAATRSIEASRNAMGPGQGVFVRWLSVSAGVVFVALELSGRWTLVHPMLSLVIGGYSSTSVPAIGPCGWRGRRFLPRAERWLKW